MLITILLINTGFINQHLYANESPQETQQPQEQEQHFADYTEMYGYTPSEKRTPIGLHSDAARASTPQALSYIAVFIEFSDLNSITVTDINTLNAANQIMNVGGTNNTTIGNIPITSMKEYLKKYSYNKFDVTTSFFPKDGSSNVIPYMAPQPRGYYMKHSSTNTIGYSTSAEQVQREKELIDGAMVAIKPSVEAELTADQIDPGNDGNIDAISFFAEAPKDSEDTVGWGDLLWSHKLDGTSSVDFHGKRMASYNLIRLNDPSSPGGAFSHAGTGNPNRASFGVIYHEYLHTLGLPDLYRGETGGKPVAFYDIMAQHVGDNPQGILSFLQREYLRWGDPIESITNSQSITLQRPTYTNGNEKISVKIQSPMNAKEYFIVEFYQNQPEQLPIVNTTGRADGLIIYRINTDNYGNMGGGSNGQGDAVFVFRPNETKLGAGEGDLKDAVILPTTGNSYGKTLGEGTSGWDKNSLYYSNGSNSGVKINITNSTADTITFEITVPTVTGSGTADDPYLLSEPDDFNIIRGNPKAYYQLTNDIDFTGVVYTPINKLEGTLDGNNFTMKNMIVTNGGGIFKEVFHTALIKDLKIENIQVDNQNDSHAGALSEMAGGTFQNVSVLSGNIGGEPLKYNLQGVGGFVGYSTDTAVFQNCSTSANVTKGHNLGGFVGLDSGARFKDSFANGSVAAGTVGSGGFLGAVFGFDPVKAEGSAFDMKATGQTQAMPAADISGVTGYKGNDDFSFDLSGVHRSNYVITTSPALSTVNVTYTFDDSEIAEYDATTNEIYGKKVGETYVNANISVGTMKMPLKTKITVTDPTYVPPVTKPIQSITLNKTTLSLQIGGKETILPSILPIDTTDSKTVTWTSSAPGIASVSTTGEIVAKATGSAIITATTTNNKTATITVTVTAPASVPITQIELQKTSGTLAKGEKETLLATITPSNTTDDKTITWTSSDDKIATVSETGEVTAISQGTATITATTSNNLTATFPLTVTNPLTGLKLNKTEVSLELGENVSLVATTVPINTTDIITWSWSSEDDTIASVDQSGVVTANKAGITKVHVSANTTTKAIFTASATITVTKSASEELREIYNLAIQHMSDEDFLNGAPKAFIEQLEQMISTAEIILNKGTAASKEEIENAKTALTVAIERFDLVDDYKALAEMLKIDLSKYDASTIENFQNILATVQAILDDPIKHQEEISEILKKLQNAKEELVELNPSTLENELSNYDKIDYSLYVNGEEKEKFIKLVAQAKQEMENAKTNAEYQEISERLKKAEQELQTMKKANEQQKTEIENIITSLEKHLKSESITSEQKKVVEEALKAAKEALNSERLTISLASELLETLNKLNNEQLPPNPPTPTPPTTPTPNPPNDESDNTTGNGSNNGQNNNSGSSDNSEVNNNDTNNNNGDSNNSNNENNENKASGQTGDMTSLLSILFTLSLSGFILFIFAKFKMKSES